MCLDTVRDIHLNSKTVRSGYKEFNGAGSNQTFQSFTMKQGGTVPKDKWIKAEGPASIRATDGNNYPAYFHIFDEDDKHIKRTRVFYRGIKTIGTQGKERVIIAEEMYVPSNPNDWPPQPEKKKSSGNPAVMAFIDKMSGLIDDLRRTAGNA